MYCQGMCYVHHSFTIQQLSLPTTICIFHKQAALCDLCTTVCCSMQEIHGFILAHTTVHLPISVSRRCQTSRHLFSNKARVWNNCLQHTAVSHWCKRFEEGIRSTEDLVCPGCPPHIMDPDTGAKVDQMVQCDHFATLWHISEHLGISVERVHHIITQVLGQWKVSAV